MKILIAVHHFPPTFAGGAEWRAYRTAKGLRKAGNDVRVIAVDSITDGNGQTLTHKHTVFRDVPVTRLSFNLSRTADPFLFAFKNPYIGEYVKALAAEFKPDIFHLISGYLMSGSVLDATRSLRIPVVLTLTDFWFLCPRITLIRSDDSLCTTPAKPEACTLCLQKERRRYLFFDRATGGFGGRALSVFWKITGNKFLNELAFRRKYLFEQFLSVDVVISPSLFLKDLFESRDLKPKRFLYMRQGLDLKNEKRLKKTKNHSGIRIGYIGQISKHKGVDVLIDAFCTLQTHKNAARLILYGNPSQFPHFTEQLYKKLGGRADVTFAGRFENTDIKKVHETIDVLVVPSVWYENSPNVILEAFVMGTPVVVSHLGGMAELVVDGVNGFVFEPGNAHSLAHILQRFIHEPELTSRLTKAMPPVKTVSEEITELADVYASIL